MRRRELASLTLGAAAAWASGCRGESTPPTAAPSEADPQPASAPPAEPTPPAASKPEPANEAPAVVGVPADQVRFRFEIDGEHVPDPPARYRDWIDGAARMVESYYGVFPVSKLTIMLSQRRGSGVGFGQHQDGRWVKVRVGSRATATTLRDDWVMVHEMLHAAFPDLERRHGWMQEGQATYLEPLVRARAGIKSVESVWAKWARMMPYGQPKVGDRGLDNTRTWGRLYWGGALFWLHVDVEARRATANARGVEAAFRAILQAGGNGRANWSTERVVEVGDAAIGAPVLSDAYDRLAKGPGEVDLDALWAKLGVRVISDRRVELVDDAPWADIRRAMVPPAVPPVPPDPPAPSPITKLAR